MESVIVNRSPRHNEPVVMDNESSFQRERSLSLSDQPCYIKMIGVSSLMLFILFIIMAIATFVMIMSNEIEQITVMFVLTTVLLVLGSINGLTTIILISKRENKELNNSI